MVKSDFPVYSRRPLCEKSKTGKIEIPNYSDRGKKNISAKLMLHVFKDERQVLFFN